MNGNGLNLPWKCWMEIVKTSMEVHGKMEPSMEALKFSVKVMGTWKIPRTR